MASGAGDEALGISAPIQQNLVGMQQLQQQRSLRRVNELANTCFDECITDFSVTRQLGSGERDCLHACTQKYLAFTALVGQSFLESLAADPRFRAGP